MTPNATSDNIARAIQTPSRRTLAPTRLAYQGAESEVHLVVTPFHRARQPRLFIRSTFGGTMACRQVAWL